MKTNFFSLLALLLFSALDLQFSTVHAQGTAFSYQGSLSSSGAPANGSYDMAFTLYSTNLTGVPIAGPVTNTAIAVSNGLFSTSIDFGNVYSGESNWLEIAVSTNQADAFTTLAPRQQLMPVPYAITAANLSGMVSSAQLPAGVVTNGSAGVNLSGTFSGNGNGLTSLPAAVVTNTETGVTLTGAFNGNGGGLTNLNAAKLTGQLSVSNLPAAVLTNTETGVTLSGTFNGNGSGLTSLPTAVVTNNETGVTLTGTFSGNGAGVTNVPGATPWQAVSGSGQTVAANQAYLLTNSAELSLMLPGSANAGDIVTVSGITNWSVDYGEPGVTWIAQNSVNTNWQSVASSSDGTHLVAVAGDAPIYTSTNSGVTWTAQNSAFQLWQSVASSSDGTHLVAGTVNGPIYTSANSGVTWTAQNSGTQNWFSVASSSDGTHLVAVAYNGPIYTSANSGVTWTAQNSTAQEWYSVASSSDGTHLVAVVYAGPIYTSTNSGVIWTAQNTSARGQSVASSSDGTHLVTVAGTGQIYTSTDSGVTWTAQTNSSVPWYCVASSSDGTHLVAGTFGGQIYTSTNSGMTWTAQNSGTEEWYSVASSSDGAKLVAGVNGGQIYTSDTSSFSGLAGTTVQYQYLGNNQWQPVEEPASQIAGTISATRLPSSVVTNTETGVTLTGAFNGNGSGLTNVALLNASQTFNGQNNFTNMVGIGTTSPLSELHVRGAGDTEISVESVQGGHRWTLQSSDTNSLGLSSSFQVIDRTAGISRMIIYTNGNILIPGNLTNSGSLTAGGNVRIGTNYAIESTENLRIVRGLVIYNGGTFTATGTGFTVVRNATGNFTITFSPAFTDANPTMTVTPAESTPVTSVIGGLTTSTSALVEFYNSSGAFTDPSAFYFIVVGTP